MANEMVHPVYSVEIDNCDKNQWSDLLLQFDDATIYQTCSANVNRRSENNLSHLILKKNGKIVGVCQVAIIKILFLKTGIANIHRGPVWRKRGAEVNFEIFIQMLIALKNEYATKRGLMLRIWPNEFEDPDNKFVSTLESLGFKRNFSVRRYRTFRLDLSPSLEILRKNLGKTWRLHLNRAEKNDLKIISGTGDDLYGSFMTLLKEMIKRKRFVPKVNYSYYRVIQNNLPENLKMKIMVGEFCGEPVCSIICPAIGDTGLYLFGATGDKGMQLYGSYLLHWRIIKWLKEKGCRWYDLGGIDPEENPGTYQFKHGLAGKMGRDEVHIGQFNFYHNVRSYLLNIIVNTITLLREKKYKLCQLISK